ncbi:MAG: peptidoglycan-associated lipoprotein Pal [Bdellovibrionales bacterium]|nr:peptidoglycan-associated lipoprotein Pal [Bdellovibrionales bacterium]
MKAVRLTMLVLSVLFIQACTCKTKPKAVDNVPVAMAGDILKDVYFAFDKSDLSAESKATLQTNASWLKENSSASVTIEGHCDERGTREYNLALGQRRAQSAFDYLRGLGIEDSRMSTVSYGEDQPLDPRSNEEAWAVNRRAHFRINQ